MSASGFLRRGVFVLAPALFLTACAVGPDFERPPAPAIATYESTPLPPQTESVPGKGGEAQKFVSGDPIPAEWWKLFHSEPLNQMINEALVRNPDIDAATAALKVARENTLAGYGLLLPTADGGFTATRQKISGSGFGSSSDIPEFSTYNASVTVSYGIDIWGGARRSIEQLGAAEDYQRFALEAARMSLSANVVTTAVQEAKLRGQIESTKSIIAEEKKVLEVLKNQLELGGIAKSGYLAQVAQVAQTETQLPPLEKQLAQTRHLLSVLTGRFPSEEPKATFDLESLTLPQSLPVSLPSQLVSQRPDIRAAEANLHAASAAIGIATANMLPQITLSGDIGSDAGKLLSLFGPGTGVWTLAGGITQPLFHGGELLHKRNAAEAAYDQAAAIYRKTVLGAFQDVADTLRALQADAATLRAASAAAKASRDSLELSKQQYKDGAISYVALLDAEKQENQTQLALIQAQALRYADTAALFTALGGGWWNKINPATVVPTETTVIPANTNLQTQDSAPVSEGVRP